MTVAEIERAVASKQRLQKLQAQEQASHNYILADLIGKSVARIYGSSNKMPSIAEAYPSLFDTTELEERRQEKAMELSVARFRQFAQHHNKKYEEVGQ